jgi:hypothetical protein
MNTGYEKVDASTFKPLITSGKSRLSFLLAMNPNQEPDNNKVSVQAARQTEHE